MGAALPGHLTRAQPHEGNYERTSSSLHGCLGATNQIPVHGRGTTLLSPSKVQNASDRNVRQKDLIDHLNTYKNEMELHGYQDPVRCRAFTITLKGLAFAWFNRLPPSSISFFREISIAFVSHFIGAQTYKKPSYHLLTIKQSPQENLKSYIQRFNAESLRVDILDEKFATTAFIAGLGVQSNDLMFSISKNPQASKAEVLAKVEKYINGEEALLSKRENSSAQKEKGRDEKKRERSLIRRGDRDRSLRRDRENRERSLKRRGNVRDRLDPPHPELQQRYPPRKFTPLIDSMS